MKESAVVASDALHVGGAPVLLLKFTGEPQTTAVESGLEPFINCTMPVGAAPLLCEPTTVAVSVTLVPATMELWVALTEVTVGDAVTMTERVLLALFALKLGSPE